MTLCRKKLYAIVSSIVGCRRQSGNNICLGYSICSIHNAVAHWGKCVQIIMTRKPSNSHFWENSSILVHSLKMNTKSVKIKTWKLGLFTRKFKKNSWKSEIFSKIGTWNLDFLVWLHKIKWSTKQYSVVHQRFSYNTIRMVKDNRSDLSVNTVNHWLNKIKKNVK